MLNPLKLAATPISTAIKMKNKKVAYLKPIAFATAQLFALSAYAQDFGLISIDVVANTIAGTGASLSQTPSNAQTLKARDIEDQGVGDLANLLNNNLGSVGVSNGTGNPYQNDVSYRGFQATSLLGAPVGLSVYFDGMRMNEPFGSIVNWDLIPMNAVSSINVLPGSNPVFGLNTLGGALVINTKNGKDDPGTEITALGGSFHRTGIQAESGWVDEAHGTDYFISANFDKQDGFRDYSGSDVKQFFGKARWRSGVTSAELSLTVADTSLNGTQSLPMDMMANPSSAYTRPDSTANKMLMLNLKGSHWFNEENQLSANVYYRKSDSNSVNSNAQLDDGCFNDDGSLATSGNVPKCANKAPNGTAVNSVTGTNALGLGFGRWTSSINSSLVESGTNQESVGVGLQWSNFDNLLGRKNSFTAGAGADYSRISYQQNTYLAKLVNYETVVIQNQEYGFTSNGLVPSSTNPLAFSGSNVLSSVNLNSNTTSFSTYFTDTYEVTDKLNLTASGSYNFTAINQSGVNNQYLNDDGGYNWTDAVTGVSYYNPSYLGAYKYSNSGAGFAPTPLAANGVGGPESNGLDGNHTYQRFNPAFGFNYNFDKNDGIFGGYSESMRAPTSIELSCANPNSPCALPTGFNGDPDLKAVVARTFEIGARGKLGANTFWNAAAYDSRLQNDIQFIATSSTFGYFANVGETERRGFELGAHTKFDQLFLSANYGYVNAVYKSAFTTPGGANVVSGDSIPGIPNQSLKLRAAYSASPSLLIGTNVILVSSQWAHGNEDNSDPNGKVAGYGVLNLDVHYKINENLKVFGLVNNLLNNQYSTYALSGQTSIYSLNQQNFVTPAAPRAIWVGLTYSFGGKKLSDSNLD